MKVDRYVAGSVARTAGAAVVLCTLMMVSVRMFSHLDALLRSEAPPSVVLRMALLYVPGSFTFTLAPCLLFAVAFTFSQLSANNELICLYNATFGRWRLVLPVLALGISACFVQFLVQEEAGVPAGRRLAALQAEWFGATSTSDRRDITLNDFEAGYVFHARSYDEEAMRARNVDIILLDPAGRVEGSVQARTARWDAASASWVLGDVLERTIDWNDMLVATERKDQGRVERLTLTPELLADNSANLSTMSRPVARAYLARMQRLDIQAWRLAAVDWEQRLLGCLAPLVMVCIACALPYRFKRNVLLFSIILSLCFAVVYYVLQMVALILARQGVIPPRAGMLAPMAVILLLASFLRLVPGSRG